MRSNKSTKRRYLVSGDVQMVRHTFVYVRSDAVIEEEDKVLRSSMMSKNSSRPLGRRAISRSDLESCEREHLDWLNFTDHKTIHASEISQEKGEADRARIGFVRPCASSTVTVTPTRTGSLRLKMTFVVMRGGKHLGEDGS